ncbi:hypothetical protein M422DRAFT_265462 [Sphaerobolus stellatus SS14]|uniref:Hydrophobin n=1 Tax=Sphaerobolus stellatus (strain SS14) TaxID=990650 RepID=A0A0C9TR76_SPHS4|nr:hypothetical protein M422DRAFT_265462 [Sphaerobolus stellatus SS14]
MPAVLANILPLASNITSFKAVQCNSKPSSSSSLSLLPLPRPAPTDSVSCTTGLAQCCDSLATSDLNATKFLGLVSAVVQGVDVLLGLGCNPVTVIGTGQGVNCAQQPVCCEQNFPGLIRRFFQQEK